MNWNLTAEGQELARLHLGGPLTIEAATELRDVLQQAVNAAPELVIQLEADIEADLSCLQLLCAAHRTAVTAGRRLSLAAPCPDSFRRLTEEAGLACRQGCLQAQQTSCILTGGQP